MDLDNFYSDPSIETWKTILGEKLHYHFADDTDPNIDPFDKSVYNIFPFVKNNSKVLDFGCGWGGPARLLIKELNCEVIGITNSSRQYEYIKDFKVIYSNMEDFIPDQKYDVGLFFETLTHVGEYDKLLYNINNYVDDLIIVDYVTTFNTVYFPQWREHIRNKKDFINPLKKYGYEVKHYSERENFLQPAINYWINNLKKIDESQVIGQVKTLKDWTNRYKQNNLKHISICTIHAIKQG
jgi:cyclopropane fatty-acyl-phospholipid synthase-like methyltransferase